jgi:cell division protein FtsX
VASDKTGDSSVTEGANADGTNLASGVVDAKVDSERVVVDGASVVVDSVKLVADRAKLVEGASVDSSGIDSSRVDSARMNAPVVEIGPRSIPAHLSSTGSHGTKSPARSSSSNTGSSNGIPTSSSTSPSKSSTALGFGEHRGPEPKSSTELGFGPHRSPELKPSTEPGFGFLDRTPAANDDEASFDPGVRAASDTDNHATRDNGSDTPRFRREALRASVIARMGSSLRRAFRFAFREPRAGLWSMLVVVCALTVVGVSALAAKHVDAWTMRTGDGGSMVVYLGEGVDDATAGKLLAELQRLPGVQHAELVAPAESAKRLQQALGGDASLMDGVDIAALPASVELVLAPGVRDVVAMSPTVRALRGAHGVDDVVLDEASEDRTTAALGTVRTIVWTGAALLAGLALIIALATIRLRLDRDPEEQRISRMLGAGPSFLLMPSIVAGMIIGVIAAAIAAGAIIGALYAYGDSIVAALAGPLGAIELAMPSVCEVAIFVGLGGVLGLLGGGLAGASRVAR